MSFQRRLNTKNFLLIQLLGVAGATINKVKFLLLPVNIGVMLQLADPSFQFVFEILVELPI